MAAYLGGNDVRLFDYPRWAEPLRDEIRAHAQRLAAEAGLRVEFLRVVQGAGCNNEDQIQHILAQSGDHPGLVHVFSVAGAYAASLLRRVGQLSARCQREVGNDFSSCIQGTRIRRYMGPAKSQVGIQVCFRDRKILCEQKRQR